MLKEAAAYLGSAKQFTFHADVSFDHVLPSGQKLQFSAAEDVVLRRPGGLYVEWNSDLGARQFWYDGKSITLYDPALPFYASAAAPPEIDDMLNQLVPKLNFSPPLADLLYRDPYKLVRGKIQYGFDLGQSDVDGRNCRTLAFVEKDSWGGYYSGLGFGAGLAIGATVAALPVAAAAISVAGNPYYYANGVYYAAQGGQYAVVPPPQGAVVASAPPSCSDVEASGATVLDCGGAFYAPVSGGYQVIPPPVGATVSTLPNGAVDRNINGVTYFAYGGAYYRPFYSGSGVIYEVVANPS